jgi:hypothetical protein
MVPYQAEIAVGHQGIGSVNHFRSELGLQFPFFRGRKRTSLYSTMPGKEPSRDSAVNHFQGEEYQWRIRWRITCSAALPGYWGTT